MLAAKPGPEDNLDRWISQKGYRFVIGVDEAGRGPWAGPVTAAAVLLDQNISNLDDSKKLRPKLRAALREEIFARSLGYAVKEVSVERIDRINILQASLEAMSKAILNLQTRFPQADCVLVDGLHTPPNIVLPCYAFARADSRSKVVAAASILAKEDRDEKMRSLDKLYPNYGFAKHKGYGTAFHQSALATHGPCPIHRRSFAPIKALLER